MRSTLSVHPRDWPTVALVLVVAAMLAAICERGGGASGKLLLASQGSIVARDVSSGAEELVLAPVGGNGVALRDPARSPNSTRIAYVRVAPSGGADAAADLWLAAVDGRDPHPSVRSPDLRIAHPQWLDEQRLLAIVRSPAGVALERIIAATGDRTIVVAGALDFGLSRDRKRVVYVQSLPDGATTLFTAGVDATGVRALLPPDQRFATMMSPRFSPDGTTVVFATPAPGAPTDTSGDVWAVDAAGGTARRLATLQEPSPSLAFGRDGRTLYALSPRSLSEIDVATGAVRRLRDSQDATTLDWSR